MDLNEFFHKDNDANYYISEQRQRQFLYNTIKKMTKEQLEDDLFGYVEMTHRLQDYIERHKTMNEKQVNRLWHILNFEK